MRIEDARRRLLEPEDEHDLAPRRREYDLVARGGVRLHVAGIGVRVHLDLADPRAPERLMPATLAVVWSGNPLGDEQ
ncbi:MAG: hypothetical protein ACOZNI_30105 [Myxococcota bacterium]